ncbi:hypothetical protein [Streptomyces sp.]|uniref:hypothetical protein n=1 Tax=Streptomyces sp. TaxID=1931 RepID=UPI002D6B067B|nr:hypothetical protein [Streptomyces sp.]HZF92045.1 hypothetical protein [Streptomyces sp.]
MTPARRTTHTCYALAAALSVSAAYLATHHWLYALPAVTAATVFLSVADCYRIEDRRIRARHEQALLAALADEQLPPADARRQLDDGCCDRWWTSAGAEHDRTCRTIARRSAA